MLPSIPTPPVSPRTGKGFFFSKTVSVFLMGSFFGFVASSLVFLSLLLELTTLGEKPLSMLPIGHPKSLDRDVFRHNSTDESSGWKTIHVFVGDTEHMVDASTIPRDYFTTTKWFSQFRQDLVVSTLLHEKRNGYFVDLAANDAIRISNTFALERYLGWKGLCIEPNPVYWSSLSYRKCHVVASVVGHKRMEEVLFKFGSKGPQSGIVGKNFRNKEPIHNREEKRRSTVTLQEIFERFDTPPVIDYLSLDVEGAETYVMEAFPFDRYRFNVLTIEEPSTKLQQILKTNGYILLHHLRSVKETLWVHMSVQHSLNLAALEIEIPKYSERV